MKFLVPPPVKPSYNQISSLNALVSNRLQKIEELPLVKFYTLKQLFDTSTRIKFTTITKNRTTKNRKEL